MSDATTEPEPEPEEVEPLMEGNLGPVECKRRKRGLFTLQLFTELLSICTTYLVLEVMEIRQMAAGNTPTMNQKYGYSSRELLAVTFALFFINIAIAIYCYSDDGNIKRTKDLTCYNQVAGMKTFFTVNMILAIASVFVFRYDLRQMIPNNALRIITIFIIPLVLIATSYFHYMLSTE